MSTTAYHRRTAQLPRRALVTGGAGFLGSHLVTRLLRAGWRVVVLDDLSRGSRSALEQHASNAGFTLIEGSVVEPADVRTAVAESRPEVVFHLAALHFIPYCAAHPDETILVNVVGTECLLDAVARLPRPPHAFVLASTGDVYEIADVPHREGDPLGSSNVYGGTKIACERLLALARRRTRETRFLAARFFNIFGRGETNPHVLPDIVGGIAAGGPLQLGNLNAQRDYVHVSDVADALLRLADYRGEHDAFNVGTGCGASVAELLRRLERILGRALVVETDPKKLRPIERRSLIADCSRLRTELGWEPRVTLDEGLTDLVREAGILDRPPLEAAL